MEDNVKREEDVVHGMREALKFGIPIADPLPIYFLRLRQLHVHRLADFAYTRANNG